MPNSKIQNWFCKSAFKIQEVIISYPYMRVFSDKEPLCSDIRILEKLEREESGLTEWSDKQKICIYILSKTNMGGTTL